MSEAIRVVVVDDHTLFRRGLISLLHEMLDIQVVGEASNGKEAIDIILRNKPELVLLDVNMPIMDGVETVKALRSRIDCHILMLTISKDESDLIGAIRAGADGYLLKNAEPEELQNAISLVMDNKSIISPEVTRQVFQAVSKPLGNTSRDIPELTPRELDVLRCLSMGKTTSQTSKQLYISENTVKTHVRKILDKLKASNRTEAVSKAVQYGFINIEDQ
ncbi:MAG: response regulator transcription factor [Anaerolineae bacterium]|jgi:two-component system nitrate/nitrite response regulator NarL|nr:response regulator transcription factor [Anaerolineae bacterium]MBT3714042.1 response regulator transcription factor [Anaerolineae bacterium]MBT4310455.1 response regulator transcription factor [Anaerolineae bacterium]MBT4458982.1 response regulator transcription factor [Anaerolineae bacterium]MBT4842357.1 response regulator transcription factor [Anaerolineae bacterium]